MKEKRGYVMHARAADVQETRLRIMEALRDMVLETLTVEIPLREVAARAGVSVQTVLRHFDNRDGLFAATLQHVSAGVAQQRGPDRAGSIEAAIGAVFDEYERVGDFMLRMLAQEFTNIHARALTDRGREVHRGWVHTAFEPQLAAYPARRREEIIDLLVVATDIYTWKLLRRDRALSRRAAEHRVNTLIAGVLIKPPEGT